MVMNADGPTSLVALQMPHYKELEVVFFDHLNIYHILMFKIKYVSFIRQGFC
jgi:hypothetical protein